MVSPDLTARQAFLALKLGGLVAEFRYQFEFHALSTQSDVEEHAENAECVYGHLRGLLSEIYAVLNSINGDPVMGHVPAERLEWSCAYEVANRCLDKFFGTDDGMSDDWHAIVQTYTSLLDHEEFITDRGYRRAAGQLARKISQHIPEYVLRAEDVGKNFPEPQCSFFHLGNSLLNGHFYLGQLFSRSEWQDSQEGGPIFRYLTRKQKAIETLYRNCATLLPKAGFEVPEDLGLYGVAEYLKREYESIRNDLEHSVDSAGTVDPDPVNSDAGSSGDQAQPTGNNDCDFGIIPHHGTSQSGVIFPSKEAASKTAKLEPPQIEVTFEKLGTTLSITYPAIKKVTRQNAFEIDKLTIFVADETSEISWIQKDGKESPTVRIARSYFELLIALLKHHNPEKPPTVKQLALDLKIEKGTLATRKQRLSRELKRKVKVIELRPKETRLRVLAISGSNAATDASK